MATTRTGRTHWEGNLLEGSGEATLASSGLGTFPVSWPSRAEEPNGRTSPEELIGAAHSACFCMAFSARLANAGAESISLDVSAEVTFVPGTGITGVHLTAVGNVAGITAEEFAELAEDAKQNCPVSQALTGTTVTLEATLA